MAAGMIQKTGQDRGLQTYTSYKRPSLIQTLFGKISECRYHICLFSSSFSKKTKNIGQRREERQKRPFERRGKEAFLLEKRNQEFQLFAELEC
jgi:hypothetical protein